MRDATGAAIEITYHGKSKPCIPDSSRRSQELRDSGTLAQGSVIVEMLRADVAALALVDRSEVEYGPDRRPMKVMIFGDDPADPCQLLTLSPDRRR